ncbi:MAG: hypothetical protein ACI9ZT_001256 [Gammaproteobacteria bacterium]|jgi:hypothetical protein
MFSRLIVLVCLNLIMMFAYAEEGRTRIGYAYDKQTEKLVYIENHFEEYVDGMILTSRVIYTDSSEKIIASKTVDFSNNEFMPEFALQNSETGHKEITRFVQSEYEITFSKKGTAEEEEARLSYPADGISDAGFDNFIIKHWDELTAGEVFKRNFLIPSMLNFIKFRIYQDEIIDEEGQSLRVINIEPDSFFIRVFAGTTKLFYDKAQPKLRKFDGISNMRDSNGANYKVTIKYEEAKKLTAS